MKNNELIILITVIAAIFLLGGLSGFGMMRYNYGGGMWGMMGYSMGFMEIFGVFFMALAIIALVLFIMWLIKQLENDKIK